MQRSASFVSSWYLKVSRLAGSAKNYVASKAQGYVEWRLAEMKKRSALIVGLQFGNQSLDSTELVFEISIFNPLEFYLPVSQASFKFKRAGSEVLTGTLKEPAWLKPGEESIIFVLVKVPLRVFINLAKDMSGDADIDYEIDLSIKIKLPIIGNVVSFTNSLPMPTGRTQAFSSVFQIVGPSQYSAAGALIMKYIVYCILWFPILYTYGRRIIRVRVLP